MRSFLLPQPRWFRYAAVYLAIWARPATVRKKLVLSMTLLGACGGFIVSQSQAPVYYSRVRIEVMPDDSSGCYPSGRFFDRREPSLRLKTARWIDSAILYLGLPDQKLEEYVLKQSQE